MKAISKGFTLIEVMIAVVIVAILAAIAVPSYTDYLRRGEIPEPLTRLSAEKVGLEQFFDDNRSYQGRCNTIGASPGIQIRKFKITCHYREGGAGPSASISEGYTLRATGDAGTLVAGFIYELNEKNVKATTSTGIWGRSSTSCWVLKKDGSC
jgi:type IV pilus assembly protein PilE